MLEVELPGVDPAEVQVYALGDALVVEGHKRPQLPRDSRPAYDRAERDYGPFRRVFDLPGPADLSKTDASLRAGLLVHPRAAHRRSAGSPTPDRGAARQWSRRRRGRLMEFLPDGTIKQTLEIPPTLALLPIRDLVVFPYMVVPLMVSREMSVAAIDEALATKDRLVLLVRADRRVARTSRRPTASTASAPSA